MGYIIFVSKANYGLLTHIINDTFILKLILTVHISTENKIDFK